MKRLTTFAVLAMMAIVSCTNDNDLAGNVNTPPNEAQTPVEFNTYLGRTAKTRAGNEGVLTTEVLQTATIGFGVFGYYTDGKTYETTASTASSELTPNFMWNQQVTYTGDADNDETYDSWKYTPLKYWPNETANGIVDGGSANGGATSTGGPDYLTFFAYAPFVDPTGSATGENGADYRTGQFSNDDEVEKTSGITALTGNTTTGDPKVSYTVSTDPTKSVDLCWAVAGTNATTYNIVTGSGAPGTQTIEAGKPNLNLTKQTTREQVEFEFKHALAKLNFTVQASVDQTTAGGTLDNATGITVSNFALSSTYPATGVLNLNNTAANTPNWNTTGSTNFSVAAMGADPLNMDIKDGVTDATVLANAPVRLLKDENASFMLIPGTSDLTITITYHVNTTDPRLASGHSRITNVITKKITSLELQAGKAYTINLVLGITSVKVNATVEGWDNGDAQNPVYLPINVEGSDT